MSEREFMDVSQVILAQTVQQTWLLIPKILVSLKTVNLSCKLICQQESKFFRGPFGRDAYSYLSFWHHLPSFFPLDVSLRIELIPHSFNDVGFIPEGTYRMRSNAKIVAKLHQGFGFGFGFGTKFVATT